MLQRFSFWVNRFRMLRRAEEALKATDPAKFAERDLFGFRLCLNLSRSVAHQLLYYEGERFIEERFLLARLLKPGITVVDVGANIGYYLLMFKKYIGAQGKVICVEPSEENLPELRKNIEINGFRNDILHEVALGMEDGMTGLRSGINSGIASLDGGPYQVPLRRLDSLVRERIDLLKIDVEGYEGQVLAGARELLMRYRPTVFLELHPHIVRRFGFTTRNIVETLSDFYPRITLYERKRPEMQDIWEKIAIRYGRRDPLIAVKDVDTYLERYDKGTIAHTFWAVCQQ